MFRYITVGGVVVGAYRYPVEKTRILRAIAPGCKPRIKKGYSPPRKAPQSNRTKRGEEVRQQKPQIGNYEKIVFLKPGEFKL